VNYTTETIATLDSSLARHCRRRDCWAYRARRSETQRSLRTVAVVVFHEDAQSPLELLLVKISNQSRHSERTVRTNRSATPLE
jgi:hypothetical protein